MEQKDITGKAIADLREAFGIGSEHSRSTEKDGVFVISTAEYSRREVMETIMDYTLDTPGINCLIETVGKQEATRFTIKPQTK